jgi:hypothetical protein
MTGSCRLFSGIVVVALASAGSADAQGRGGAAWATAAADAQRTSSIRTDPKISPASMQQPGFQFLWKRTFENPGGPSNVLTQPVLLPNIIAYKGFKALAFVGASTDNVYAVDYELNRVFWTQHLATASPTPGTAACPGGLMTITKAAAPVPPAGGRGGAGGPAGRGAVGVQTAPGAAGVPPPPGAAGAPVPPGAAGGPPAQGRGRADALAAPQRPTLPGGRDAGENVYAISSGGMVHLMNPQVGTDQIPPVKFLPPNAKVVGSILVDTRLFAATTGKCGGAANGVWAIDLVGTDKAVSSFDTKGAGVAGAVAPTFGTDGTIYVATLSGDSPVANAVLGLDAKTLEQRDSFSAGSPFTSAPVVFQYKGRDLIVAANKDGRLYLLDSASLGGADHKTPLHKTAPFTAAAPDVTGLASWADAGGTRWVIATTGALAPDAKFTPAGGAVGTGGLVAFTVSDSGDAPILQPQWVSAELKGPLTPAVINGVVFALASGESGATSSRATRGVPAVLYALDGATGRQLWTSGNTITSTVRSVGPSGGDSQVYVAAEDGTLYAFGMPAER